MNCIHCQKPMIHQPDHSNDKYCGFLCSNLDECATHYCYMELNCERICYYSFSLDYQGVHYYLRGSNFSIDNEGDVWTILGNPLLPNPYIEIPYFIPLYIEDNLNGQVWQIFHRLKNLIIFS